MRERQWSKDFMEAGKKCLRGDRERGATSSEVLELKRENDQRKALVAELSLKNGVPKQSWDGLVSESETVLRDYLIDTSVWGKPIAVWGDTALSAAYFL